MTMRVAAGLCPRVARSPLSGGAGGYPLVRQADLRALPPSRQLAGIGFDARCRSRSKARALGVIGARPWGRHPVRF